MLLCRTLDVTLDLKDPQYPENNLGTLELTVTLTPKENMRDAVRNSCQIILNTHSYLSWGQHFKYASPPMCCDQNRNKCLISQTQTSWRLTMNQTCLNIVSIISLSNFMHQSSAAVLFPVRKVILRSWITLGSAGTRWL